MIDPIAFATSTNPDILYMHQAMHAPDCNKFIKTMATEIQGHEQMGNFIPAPLSCIPKGAKLIDMVWSMCCKHQIKMQEIYKWKGHLHVQWGKQDYGIHYWETYAPIVTWQTVCIFLIMSIIFGWHSCELDFVMAYPQVPAQMPLYMRIPQGYTHASMSRKTHALKLLHNVYRQKQAGRVWNQYLDEGMIEAGFTPSSGTHASTIAPQSLSLSTLMTASN